MKVATAIAALLTTASLMAAGIVCAEDAPLVARRAGAHTWYVQGASGMASRDNRGFMSNAGFVVTSQGVVVFDALATPVLARQLLAAIRGVTDQPVRRVIVSHYHADHIYGLQVFKASGAQIWAKSSGQRYLASDLARERLAQRREALAPWVDENTHLVAADRWLDFGESPQIAFEMGGVHFELIDGGAAHSPDDLMLRVVEDRALFAGDLFFAGRLPFVVDGNTREWLRALDRIMPAGDRHPPRVVIPGHGPASRQVEQDLRTTRGYLIFLRERMGAAVEGLVEFDQAYQQTDWSGFAALPTFEAANRRNAYSVYLEMQAESLHATPGAR